MSDDIAPTVDVLYTCLGCKTKKRVVTVVGRDPDQNAYAWMKLVRDVVTDDHERISPRCRSKKFELHVPTKGRDYIGQPTKQ
jgi:hypothetical protein